MSTSTSWRDAIQAPPPQISWLDRWSRRAFFHMLSRIEAGCIMLVDGDERRTFGRSSEAFPITVTVHVYSPSLYRKAALGGHIALARAYADGAWSCDDLTGLIRIFARNLAAMDSMDRGWARLAEAVHRVFHLRRSNSREGSRRNIAAHYDLGNDFFQLFLDETMTYSAGIFEPPDASMHAASIAKLDRICRKLRLESNDEVLEIGSGWGSFALHAAQRYGCRVTTATVSKQQYELAKQKVAEAGLGDRVRVLLKDYRELAGQYDKLVSIEMIEAVGHQYFDTFFRKCSSLLKPDGLMALQAITIADQRYEVARRTVDFIKREIFPGSCIPSIERMCRSIAAHTDLRLTHLEDITPHYATTLQRWRETLHRNAEAIRSLGYSDRFMRLWEFYLCYCEGSFEERYIGSVQIMLSKPRNRSATLLGNFGTESFG